MDEGFQGFIQIIKTLGLKSSLNFDEWMNISRQARWIFSDLKGNTLICAFIILGL